MRLRKLGGLVAACLILVGPACGSAPPERKVTAASAAWHARPWNGYTGPTPTTTMPPPPATVAVQPKPQATGGRRSSARVGSGACGGDLPPCWVMNRESGGNLNAYNPTGCAHKDGSRGCYGKWQCDPRTCSGHGTEEQQDAEARALWNNGRGCANWNAC